MLQKILLGLVSAYQAILRPFLGASCRFTPSCSEYAKEAIQKYGAWKGFGFALKRLISCYPGSKKPVFDPVP